MATLTIVMPHTVQQVCKSRLPQVGKEIHENVHCCCGLVGWHEVFFPTLQLTNSIQFYWIFFFFSGIILNEVYTVFSVSSDGKNNTSPFGLCTEFLERSRKEQSS